MTTKQNVVLAVLCAGALVGTVAIVHLYNQMMALEATRSDLAREVSDLRTGNSDLARKLSETNKVAADLEGSLKQNIASLYKPPTADELASAIIDQTGDALITAIGGKLIENPNAVEALRGRDANPAEVAGYLLDSPTIIQFGEVVANTVWATHRNDLTGDQELIATIARSVYETYGAELAGPSDAKEQAALIADQLGREPGFAAMVAAAKVK